jgi:hypothetical protein
MRRTLRILGLVSLILTSFLAGILAAGMFHFFTPIVTVEIHNISGKEIDSLRLVHEHGTVEVAHLPADATRSVRFYAPGESSYKIALVFSDGQALEGGAGYVEAGYSTTETITASEIKSDHNILGSYRP